MWHWPVNEFEAGRLLPDALALRIPAAPRGYLRQLIRKGRIRSGDRLLTMEERLPAGAVITATGGVRLEEAITLCGILPQQLLYEDESVLVVFKPAGVAVHRALGHDTNLTEQLARFTALRQAPYRIAPVHRLDVGTSGPVLFGKGRRAISGYGQLLMDGRLHKRYLALVSGAPPARGDLTAAVPANGRPRPALTRYQRVEADGRYALLELDLVTGRPHQARVHLAGAGWPIVGDRRYGGVVWTGLSHPFLHCHLLAFPTLAGGEPRQVSSALPQTLMKLLADLGWPADAVAAACAESTRRSGQSTV